MSDKIIDMAAKLMEDFKTDKWTKVDWIRAGFMMGSLEVWKDTKACSKCFRIKNISEYHIGRQDCKECRKTK
jgi:hypothetical protein